MRIIGIDPGTIKLGWCVLDDGKYHASGTITAPAAWHIDRRLDKIHACFLNLLTQNKPAEMAIEAPFVGRFARAALALGEIRGLIKTLARVCGIKVYSYEPTLVKRAVCSGRASKAQVNVMVLAILSIEHAQEDEADACAVAICHTNRAVVNVI